MSLGDKPTLDEATTDDLIEALMSRTEHGIILMNVPDDANTSSTRRWSWGNRFYILGMLTVAQSNLVTDITKAAEEE